MKSTATTVKEYLASLPEDRRAAVEAIRTVILKNLDKDYEEVMQYGMIGYVVPHRVFPQGYHCDPKQPLAFAGLASQKNYIGVYLMGLYIEAGGGAAKDAGDEEGWFRAAWAKTGKKLDMGKCCVRFKRLEDAALDVIGEAIKRMPAKKYLGYYLRNLETQRGGKGKKANAKGTEGKGKDAEGKRGKKASAKRSGVKNAAAKSVAKKTSKRVVKKVGTTTGKTVAKRTAARSRAGR
ncbi:MAG: DUF1801 domain-containing protein [Phycisphaerales bacterium]|nr:MAG: DUF1801 domain-containing protein [Phycisphaerales bacterium]